MVHTKSYWRQAEYLYEYGFSIFVVFVRTIHDFRQRCTYGDKVETYYLIFNKTTFNSTALVIAGKIYTYTKAYQNVKLRLS